MIAHTSVYLILAILSAVAVQALSLPVGKAESLTKLDSGEV